MKKKDIPGRTQAMKTARGIINNLNAASEELMRAGEAKYFLNNMHRHTGETRQNMIIKCVLYAVKNHPDYSPYYDNIETAWKNTIKE